MDASRSVDSRFVGLAAVSGAAGGVAMAMWMMIYSAATGNGFWTPLNVCMASFVYRSDAQMMLHDMMMHPGMSMNEPIQASHLGVGFLVHMGSRSSSGSHSPLSSITPSACCACPC
jgi:hypothetical protein